jgi:phage FluMu protein Com
MKETLRGVMPLEARCPRCREVVVYGIDLEYRHPTCEC